jgi:hypothetical protein
MMTGDTAGGARPPRTGDADNAAVTSAGRMRRQWITALLSRNACGSEPPGRCPTYVSGIGRGRRSASIATKVNTARVTWLVSSPSRLRRHASTAMRIEVRPTEATSA